ncbi:MAG: FkbM family methyltransferase, partial [Ilumatobacteraceae bacterium]
DLDRLLRLLFPGGLDEHQRARVAEVIGADEPFAPTTVRRVLGALDQQTAPTPVVVRFGPDDLERLEVPVPGHEPAVLVLDRADASVSVQVRADGHYEPYLSAVLDDLLGSGDVFVDVGANVGYHTVRAARSVGTDGRVIAVEANPENARLLALSVAENGFEHVDVWPFALGAHLGHVHFGVHIGSNGGFAPDDREAMASGRGTVAPVVPLDALGLERVDVMKIDVEGAEPIVLEGALATIERCRPAVVMELSCEMTRRVGGIEPDDHLRRLTDRGYRLHLIDRAGGPPIEFESPAALLATWHDPLRLDDLLLLPPLPGN